MTNAEKAKLFAAYRSKPKKVVYNEDMLLPLKEEFNFDEDYRMEDLRQLGFDNSHIESDHC